MAWANFRLNVILRSALIAANACLFFFLLYKTSLTFTTIMAGAVFVLQCSLLISSMERITGIWTRFFAAVNYADFTQNFSFPKGKAFDRLKTEYGATIETLRRYSLDKEKQYQYIRTIARSIGVGILVFDRKGDVDFVNDSFKLMFATPVLRNIRELEKIDGDPSRKLREMKNGDKELLRFTVEKDRLQVIVSVRDFVLLREKYRMASAQNIGRELEENETDAWQKLARVLTHEIMNSIAPISSLASTAKNILARRAPQAGGERGADTGSRDVLDALASIEKRSLGLLSFVEDYRKFLRVPKPALGIVRCADIVLRVERLMRAILEEKGIRFTHVIAPKNLELLADSGLMEQVFINLIQNSIKALEKTKRPAIEMSARLDAHNRPVIEFADNGSGIPEELLDKIFIPFFTTKSEGSGIGLSLCRQIMRLHHGTITATSIPGKRTVFHIAL
jgi:two-component system nitrogen regulation sensor histidine kinase NtrY